MDTSKNMLLNLLDFKETVHNRNFACVSHWIYRDKIVKYNQYFSLTTYYIIFQKHHHVLLVSIIQMSVLFVFCTKYLQLVCLWFACSCILVQQFCFDHFGIWSYTVVHWSCGVFVCVYCSSILVNIEKNVTEFVYMVILSDSCQYQYL